MRHLTNTYKPDMYFPDFGAACGFNSTTLRSLEFVTWLYSVLDEEMQTRICKTD